MSSRHGLRHLPEYQVWKDLRRRCNNPNYKKWHRYGGRGIKVCWRWRYFENFIADMGYRPSSKHTIERKDNNGDYNPSNCVWATQKDQQRNHSRNHWLTIGRETLILSDWVKRLGIASKTILKHYTPHHS